MIRVVGKKAKRTREDPIDPDRLAEAAYYARKYGLTRDQALKLIKEASPPKPMAHHAKDGAKGR